MSLPVAPRHIAVSISFRYLFSVLQVGLVVGWLGTERLPAQTVEGRVVDDDTNVGISGATLLATSLTGDDSVRTVTDLEGHFILRLDEPGIYAISVERIGYASLESREVQVGENERIKLLLRLAAASITIDSIAVVAPREVRLQHQGTWEGFEARYAERSSVGSTRLWDRSDPEVRNAANVRALLRSSGRISDWSCMTVFVDGNRATGWPTELVLNLSTEQIRGVEFFGRPADAPLAYREAGGCPILVVWRRH